MINLKSSDIIYSEHDYDECFEYTDGSGRVPDGNAVGFVSDNGKSLTLFSDIVYSKHDHTYWNNYELENDPNRLVLP